MLSFADRPRDRRKAGLCTRLEVPTCSTELEPSGIMPRSEGHPFFALCQVQIRRSQSSSHIAQSLEAF